MLPVIEYGRVSAVPILVELAAVPATTKPGVAVMSYCRPEITPAPTALAAAAAPVAPMPGVVSKLAVTPVSPRVHVNVAVVGVAARAPP